MRLLTWRQYDRWLALLSGRVRACDGKIVYWSPVVAAKAAYHLEEVKPGESFDVYKCPWCLAYHVGHATDPICYNVEIVRG